MVVVITYFTINIYQISYIFINVQEYKVYFIALFSDFYTYSIFLKYFSIDSVIYRFYTFNFLSTLIFLLLFWIYNTF